MRSTQWSRSGSASAAPTTKTAEGIIFEAHFSMASMGFEPDALTRQSGEGPGRYSRAAAYIERARKRSGPSPVPGHLRHHTGVNRWT